MADGFVKYFVFLLTLSATIYLTPRCIAEEYNTAHVEKDDESVVERVMKEKAYEMILPEVLANNELYKSTTLELYPCSDCHDEDWEVDPSRRELGEPHDVIDLTHNKKGMRWCLDCHDAKNRDKFRLIDGTLVDFSEFYKVCAQCHGKIFRGWLNGMHGKRVGSWNGKKKYYLCVNCHNPHNPVFKPLKPKPRPKRPEEIKLTTGK